MNQYNDWTHVGDALTKMFETASEQPEGFENLYTLLKQREAQGDNAASLLIATMEGLVGL